MKPTIPDKLFFKIGEVADAAGVEQHVLRYWEDEFDVLKPAKNRSGQRVYQKKDLDLVLEVRRLLYDEKFTIAGAKQRLKTRKKKSDQMDFGFDREKALEWKKNLERECKSILTILDGKKKR